MINLDLAPSDSRCDSLARFFSDQTQNLFGTSSTIYKISQFFCVEIQKAIERAEYNFYVYSNGTKSKNSEKICAPAWAARLHVKNCSEIYLQFIAPKSLLGQGTFKKVKKSVTFSFKWGEKAIIPLNFWWSVYVYPKNKNLLDLKVISTGLEILQRIREGGISHTLNQVYIFSHPSKPSYDLAWCNSDLKKATRSCKIPIHPFQDHSLSLTKRDLLKCFCQIGEALLELHEKGLIHGDVKPHNMLIKGLEGLLGDFDITVNIGCIEQREFFIFNDFCCNFYKLATPFTDLWGFILSLSYLFFNQSEEAIKVFFDMIKVVGRCTDNTISYDLLNLVFSNQAKTSPQDSLALEIYKTLLIRLLASNSALSRYFNSEKIALHFNKEHSWEKNLLIWRAIEEEQLILNLKDTLDICQDHLKKALQ